MPGTSLAMLSQNLGLEDWNFVEFMKVRSMRSRATVLGTETPLPLLLELLLLRECDMSDCRH